MAMGPGKYDDLCTLIREQAHASGAMVIVIGGVKGNGFSCQLDETTAHALPDILEQIAKHLRSSKWIDGNEAIGG
jgi:hypothetical protein